MPPPPWPRPPDPLPPRRRRHHASHTTAPIFIVCPPPRDRLLERALPSPQHMHSKRHIPPLHVAACDTGGLRVQHPPTPLAHTLCVPCPDPTGDSSTQTTNRPQQPANMPAFMKIICAAAVLATAQGVPVLNANEAPVLRAVNATFAITPPLWLSPGAWKFHFPLANLSLANLLKRPNSKEAKEDGKYCKDKGYPYKHPDFDICYNAKGKKQFDSQGWGDCDTWCNMPNAVKPGVGCSNRPSCLERPKPIKSGLHCCGRRHRNCDTFIKDWGWCSRYPSLQNHCEPALWVEDREDGVMKRVDCDGLGTWYDHCTPCPYSSSRDCFDECEWNDEPLLNCAVGKCWK